MKMEWETMQRNIKEIISKMTLEEKAGLCSGRDFWHTKGIERLGIPAVMMTDGPHGLRKLATNDLDLETSIPATCFPAGAALACSWDRSLLNSVGTALGKECLKERVSILLGPAANIKRSPLCGRNFEYLSEDPYLSSEMAAAHIEGVQSQGVGTSLKHYAANNQETRRLLTDAVIDERTLREIYLASFEGAVKKSQPWTVMCSYNKINGTYGSENKYTLTDILKEEWGHEGIVVSDWGAVNERADGLRAGLELEMPGSGGEGDKKIIKAVQSGELPESVLDKAVERLLKIIFKAADNLKTDFQCDMNEHHRLARKAAGECAVLLKNEENILPLSKTGRIAVIGAFAKTPRYQGGGSSHVNPVMLDNAYDEIVRTAGTDTEISYAAGYKTDIDKSVFGNKPFVSLSDEPDDALIQEAAEAAAKADTAVIFAGLPDSYESEFFDRKHMRMPEGHNKLIEAVARVQKNVVVVLSNGSPVEMPWIGQVKAVLEMYLGGQASGGAAADILFGDVNPSGKLAETFPKKLKDNPSYLNFPGDKSKVEYREGIFVGYRYYDAAEVEPLFPFGHGLSYTDFEYKGITLDKKVINEDDELQVSVMVKNTGSTAGREVVQLYVSDTKSDVLRPRKELKGFEKVELMPGEEKTVEFRLGKRAFAYYSPDKGDWVTEDGEFRILVGSSSRDIRLEAAVQMRSAVPERKVFTRNSAVSDIMAIPEGREYFMPILKKAFGDSVSEEANKESGSAGELMLAETPVRQFLMYAAGGFTEDMLEELLAILNKA
jgi:beta-glucosidase